MSEDTAELRAYLEAKFSDLYDRMEKTYVRQDTYSRDQRFIEERQASLRGEVDSAKSTLRNTIKIAVSGLALPILVVVVTAIILNGGKP